MAVKELSDYGLTFDLISKCCKKLYILKSEVFTTLTRTLWCGGSGEGGRHRRFEETYASTSALYIWRQCVPLLIGTHLPQRKCCNSQDHNIKVLTTAKIQILCIWYMSPHYTCLSILVLSRLQEKSERRSTVRLESLNNSETTGGETTRGVGWR